jgi:hypothetical protein
MLRYAKGAEDARAVLFPDCPASTYLLEQHDMQRAGVILLGLHHRFQVEGSRNLQQQTPSNRHT